MMALLLVVALRVLGTQAAQQRLEKPASPAGWVCSGSRGSDQSSDARDELAPWLTERAAVAEQRTADGLDGYLSQSVHALNAGCRS
jgi:hypothetical protein